MKNLSGMKRKSAVWMFVEIAVLMLVVTRAASADDPDSTAPAATQPPDKSQYTLFNPVPTDLLREMATDRPDKTDSPTTIDAGHLQIETGVIDYDYDRDKFEGDNDLNESIGLGEVEFRLGILNYLELDLEIDSYDFLSETDYNAGKSRRQQGFGDMTIGESLNFWGNDDSDNVWDTAFGLEADLKIPTAQKDIGNGYPEAFFGFPLAVNLPGDFEGGAETIVSWERNSINDDYVTGWQNMAEIDRVIFAGLDVYAEYWMHTSTERHLEAQMSADFGFTLPVVDNVVLDAGVNVGLNHATDSLEATSGITVRF